MITPFIDNAGEKSIIYASKNLFKFVSRDDEICSDIDNESYHAMIIEKQKSHIELDSYDIYQVTERRAIMIHEVLSFELQFKRIMDGLRDVSEPYFRSLLPGAKRSYKGFHAIANASQKVLHDYQKEHPETDVSEIKKVSTELEKILSQRETLRYFV